MGTSAKSKADLDAVRKIADKENMQALQGAHVAGRAHARVIREQDRAVERMRQKYHQANASWQRCLDSAEERRQGHWERCER